MMILRILSFTALILLTGCVSQGSSPANQSSNSGSSLDYNKDVKLENLGPAPELAESIWLNTDEPLTSADLRGKVVLLDFWTFG